MAEFAADVRLWLYNALPEYIKWLKTPGAKRPALRLSGDWESDQYARASQIASCAKRHAADRAGASEEIPFSEEMEYRFEIANRIADIMKEAIKWKMEREGGLEWTSTDELRLLNDIARTAGTMDTFMAFTDDDGARPYAVEIKYTDADRYGGIMAKQVWQTISYMELLKANTFDRTPHENHTGFLITMYPWNAQVGYRNVWRIVEFDDGWRILDDLGFEIEPPAKTDLPVDDEGRAFFSRIKFDEMAKSHSTWYDAFMIAAEDALWARPDYDEPQDYICGRIIPLEAHQKKTTVGGVTYLKGDIKPSSGKIFGPCPLLTMCWADRFARGEYEEQDGYIKLVPQTPTVIGGSQPESEQNQ